MNLIQDLSPNQTAFCLIQKQDSDEVLYFRGESLTLDEIDQIPRPSEEPTGQRTYHSISLIPFAQIRERGYLVRHDGEKILSLRINQQSHLSLEDLLAQLPSEAIQLTAPLQYDSSEADYEALIRHIVEDEIGNGEGANFVIPRKATSTIQDFSLQKALTIFKSLVTNDYGTYWKFVFYDGKTYYIGSTPERHLSVEGRKVKMNPISGTFRKDKQYAKRDDFKADLLRFLSDPKEINELFMVVDEELKMMAKMCDQGGIIIGPLLKEMSSLIHSEYLLSGESDQDLLELFKSSMFAATVTGSPVENACKIIHKYSKKSRGYYGSALLLIGQNEAGEPFLDSPITIRTAVIDQTGDLSIQVGATLVRDSIPSEEVKETYSKSAALVNSILQDESRKPKPPLMTTLANDDDIAETLQLRNQNLSNFWFFRQEKGLSLQTQASKLKLTIIHNEDDFVYMLRHIFNALGAQATVVSFHDYDFASDQSDITILGPGPGNPQQHTIEKMQKNQAITEQLLAHRKKSMFVCLGHQVLCQHLGYSIMKKKVPHQGVQEKINLYGTFELVGFYNTFVPRYEPDITPFEVSVGEVNHELVAIKGDDFLGFQFHPESILTKNGATILKEAIEYLVR